jgi:hypothetical protein
VARPCAREEPKGDPDGSTGQAVTAGADQAVNVSSQSARSDEYLSADPIVGMHADAAHGSNAASSGPRTPDMTLPGGESLGG